MKLRNFFLIFIFGLFIFLLPNIAEAACPLSCSPVIPPYYLNCSWMNDPPGTCGCERLGLVGSVDYVTQCDDYYCCGTQCEDSSGKCACNKFLAGTNGQTCIAKDRCWSWTCSDFSKSGVWDASESKCVTCSNYTENRNLGDTSNVYAGCGSEDGNAGDGQCESACGASSGCDERPADYCGESAGTKCNSNCQLVNTCGDGTCNCGETPASCPSDCCARANPTVSLTPSSQSGNPGQTLTYTASIKNNDSSACGSSTFNLTKSCPSGWTCTLNKTSVILSPGSTDPSVTLSVASSPTATAGNYTVSATATNSAATSYYATSSATYQVVIPCTRANPTVSISPYSQSGIPGQTLYYTVYVTNNDSSGCDPSTFNLTVSTCPSGGWTCSLVSTSLTISPGGSQSSTTIRVTASAGALPGDYTFKVKATNSAATSYWGEGSGIYTIAVACTGTLNVSISGTGTCTVTTSLTATGCDGQGWQIKDDGNIKCSGTVSGSPYSYTCSSWTVSAGSYTYNLYIGGLLKDSKSVTCAAACTRSNPTVSLTPSSQSGNPGQTLTYTATVTNNDSSACGASTFNLTYSCPSGWTCSLSSSSQTISPGSSASVTLSVTSPTTATAGGYTVSVTATNSAATSYSGTGYATYTVTAPTVPINQPTVTTNPATSIATTSATLNGDLNNLGYDPAVCTNCKCITWFEWGPITAMGNRTPAQTRTFTGSFSADITGLSPNTTYYFKAFAKNGGSW